MGNKGAGLRARALSFCDNPRETGHDSFAGISRGKESSILKRASTQTFLFSLGISLFLLITAAGIVTVDAQGRRLTFGDDIPPLRTVSETSDKTVLEIRLLGHEGQVDVTKAEEIWKFLLDFCCIPHN